MENLDPIEAVVKHPDVGRALIGLNPHLVSEFPGIKSLVTLRRARRSVKRANQNAREDIRETGKTDSQPPNMPGERLLRQAIKDGLPPDLKERVSSLLAE